MQQNSSPKSLIIVFVIVGLVGVVTNLLGNIAANALPPSFIPYLQYALPAYIILSVICLGVTAWQTFHHPEPKMQENRFSSQASTLHIPSNPNVSIEDIPCGFCHQKQLQIHGQGNGTIVLVCGNCRKTMSVSYKGNTLSKIVIPTLKGIAVLTTAAEIADYLGIDPSQVGEYLLDIFGVIFDSF